MITYAVDFESYYDKVCSIKTLGNRGYYAHEDFDAYMVSVVGDDGYVFCGDPKEFDWDMLEGQIVLSHNASFDEGLFLYGVEQGWWKPFTPSAWYCTADLCAYFGIPRSLKGACKWLFGLEMSKTTRDNMLEKRWESMTPEFQAEVTEYAIVDSRYCLQIWQELGEKWPEQERWISNHTRVMMRRGIPVDESALKEALIKFRQALFDAEAMIPWASDPSKKLLSPKAFAEECRKYGIEPPKSIAIDSDEADEWIERFGEKLPFAAAMRNWRSINSLLKKLASFERATEDGRFYGGLMYCGAHTRRFSGSGGNLNLQNLPKDEMYGVKIRNLIRAKKGKKLVVVDLSQIEVRVVVWLAGDMATMERIRNTDDIYEAFAIQFKLWDTSKGSLKENDPGLRFKMKTIGLGTQYGASAGKIASISGQSLEESSKFVNLFKRTMRPVTRLWKELTNNLTAACRDGILTYELPSGNSLIYRNVREMLSTDPDTKERRKQVVCTTVRNGQPMLNRLWFGSVIENISQSLARDIFMDCVRRVEDAGYEAILHVHDEVILEVDEDEAEKCLDEVLKIMSTPPTWIDNIALAAEGHIYDCYDK